MNAPVPALAASPAAIPPKVPRRTSPRAWFRRRLDRDPRAWVLALAALEGLSAFAFNIQEKRESFYGRGGVGLVVLLAFTIVLPAAGVVGMLAHGRLLFWTGKLLRGCAEPHEIHAAFAWSQLPFIAVALPFVLEIPLRAAAAETSPVPETLSAAIAGIARASGILSVLGAAAAVAGGFLYVKFVAEAQRFSSWRSLANHVLSGLLGLGLIGGSVLAAMRLLKGAGASRIVPLALALMVVPLLAAERLAVSRRRRASPRRAA